MSDAAASRNSEAILMARLGEFGKKVMLDCISSGLCWDEAVFALGAAAQILAKRAAVDGDDSEQNCLAHAEMRFKQGLNHLVVLVPEVPTKAH